MNKGYARFHVKFWVAVFVIFFVATFVVEPESQLSMWRAVFLWFVIDNVLLIMKKGGTNDNEMQG